MSFTKQAVELDGDKPASLSQSVGLALGPRAGQARIGEVVGAGGFGHFRRAAEIPCNLVLEARR